MKLVSPHSFVTPRTTCSSCRRTVEALPPNCGTACHLGYTDVSRRASENLLFSVFINMYVAQRPFEDNEYEASSTLLSFFISNRNRDAFSFVRFPNLTCLQSNRGFCGRCGLQNKMCQEEMNSTPFQRRWRPEQSHNRRDRWQLTREKRRVSISKKEDEKTRWMMFCVRRRECENAGEIASKQPTWVFCVMGVSLNKRVARPAIR